MRSTNIFKFSTIRRLYSSTVKPKVLPSAEVLQSIEQEVYKPRKHPGISSIKTVSVPDTLIQSIENVLADFPVKAILVEGEKLSRHLRNKVPPMEPQQIQELKDKFYSQILKKEQKLLAQQEKTETPEHFEQSIKDKVIDRLKKKVYNWTPMTYDAFSCLVYLMARFPAEYAVLVKVFSELKRDKEFHPKSMFDFGSGTGTAMWACNLHYNNVFEYFNVDTSSFMNDLSLLLLQGGRTNKEALLKGVFYRQFVPAKNNLYDIVVSAYSLLELPSFEARMENILRLWNKTGRYLIIVEQGTNAGFRVINEARDYLLQISNEHNQGHVFSPCPHDLNCPRFLHDNTPCNFQVTYQTMPIGARSDIRKELYSYVIMRKGPRLTIPHSEEDWPRVVRETLVRSKHCICRVCTKHGDLQEVIFSTSKHGKPIYHCARATKWGDRLPIEIEQPNNATIEETTEET